MAGKEDEGEVCARRTFFEFLHRAVELIAVEIEATRRRATPTAKPPRMRWKTYSRLKRDYDRQRGRWSAGILDFLGRLHRVRKRRA
jgi:hypothetical protein